MIHLGCSGASDCLLLTPLLSASPVGEPNLGLSASYIRAGVDRVHGRLLDAPRPGASRRRSEALEADLQPIGVGAVGQALGVQDGGAVEA